MGAGMRGCTGCEARCSSDQVVGEGSSNTSCMSGSVEGGPAPASVVLGEGGASTDSSKLWWREEYFCYCGDHGLLNILK